MTEHEVLSALRDVYDPEVGLNIVDLGLVYSTAIDGSRLRIAMTMTTPACPMHAYLTEEVRETLLSRFEQLEVPTQPCSRADRSRSPSTTVSAPGRR